MIHILDTCARTCLPVNPWQMTFVFLSTHTLAVDDMDRRVPFVTAALQRTAATAAVVVVVADRMVAVENIIIYLCVCVCVRDSGRLERLYIEEHFSSL
jgi:hypothetical protein